MNRTIRVISRALILLLLASAPALAWDHHGWRYYYRPRVVIGVGPVWWGPPFAPWGPPPVVAVYPPTAVVVPPPVVVQPQPAPAPPVYVQREDAPPPAAQDEQAAPAPEVGSYWYYCASARQYYPKVGTCPEQWVKVPASPE